jgi:uncharacterized membrane protein YhhN
LTIGIDMHGLLIVGLIFAGFEWYAEFREHKWLIYLSKPFVMVFVITWMTVQINFNSLIGNEVMFPIIWFLLGMLFCLLGDIFVMRPDRFFLPGLFSFLSGHIFFIIGLGQIVPKKEYLLPGILIFVFVFIGSFQIFTRIASGLDAKSKTRMKIPLAVYSIVISIMLYASLLTLLEREWNYRAAIPIAFGAFLFYLSDVLYAWGRFVHSLKYGRVAAMVTYHLGQFGIALGAVLHHLYRPDT